MDLRTARSTDAGAVGAILSEFIDTTDWMPRVHSRAEDLAHAGTMIERGWVTVAETASGVVGFAACNGEDLNALYVQRAARDQGVGSALVRHLQSCEPFLQLWTFVANEGAHRFYARHGFAEVTRTDGAGNDEKLPDIRFEWRKGAV
ncbi:GNAT family N-acetyltransferase [Sulfitobacter aestuariivivens]|uniref:GNAT family N-acetyltransferase n=1 Tax=Sulfitobacter aestuariivivens TaxID=2766981 RepID=A0A927D1N7_9RHOB|nr:GNAT family N-acetyltransferase [Sulfitobacter aestuariivivens]MBD3662324.1 GNAT family N-acetyltransferase [Sulfitobacter aestuariivivens]